MSLKADEFLSGHYYHLYNRCVGNRKLFDDDEDYLKFLSYMKKYLNQAHVHIIAYCLMPNHFHLLLYQCSDRQVFLDMNRLAQCYARFYNKRHNLKGSLWGNKLQHVCIQNDSYMLRLCAYIHLNPLKAGLVTDLKNWQWSNFLEWISLRKGNLFNSDIRDDYFKNPLQYEEFISNLVFDKKDERILIDGVQT